MQLINGDALEELRKLPGHSINLVLTDPPYNIKLADWDSWKSYDEYINFMIDILKECERVLKPNGSLYFFHNDMLQIGLLIAAIRERTNFNFNSFIVWDKGNFRAQGWKNPTENNNLRCWFNTCEYCLYYTIGESKTGWETVHLDINNFKPLRDYSRELIQFCGGKKKLMDSIGGRIDHFTRPDSTQYDLCTRETYEELINKFDLRKWEKFKEYDDLTKEFETMRAQYEEKIKGFESLRFTHNLDYNHNNIFRYSRDSGENLHPCQKPLALLERLIRCSSNAGDIVLDPFMGSGSTGAACVNLERDFIGIERDNKYYEIAKKRIYKTRENFTPFLF